jgi:hypothetical protein
LLHAQLGEAALAVDGRRARIRVGDCLIHAGIDEPLTAVRPRLDGGKGIVETVWTNLHTPMFMSSPVLVGDTIDGLTQRSNGRSSRSMRPPSDPLGASDHAIPRSAAVERPRPT